MERKIKIHSRCLNLATTKKFLSKIIKFIKVAEDKSNLLKEIFNLPNLGNFLYFHMTKIRQLPYNLL
jgi:hypothetical protein